MKKTILLLILLFITGCDVEYNIHFSKDTITETVKLNLENNSENKETLNYLDQTPFYAIINTINKVEYNKKIKDYDNYKQYTFEYEYKKNLYNNSRFKHCYDAYSITENNNVITLNTSKQFRCLVYDYNEIKNLTINITSDYVVVEHNADEVKDGVYKWYINDNNAHDKPIKFSYNQKKEANKIKKFFSKYKTGIMVVISLIILAAGTVLGIYIRYKKVNKK